MSVWNKVREGIDKAGKVAQDALDEGKTRIDAYRAREQADKAAEALGYAVFRAMEVGKEIDAESRERLMRSLRERDTEARRLENELASGAHPAAGAHTAASGTAAGAGADAHTSTPTSGEAPTPAAPSSPAPAPAQQNAAAAQSDSAFSAPPNHV